MKLIHVSNNDLKLITHIALGAAMFIPQLIPLAVCVTTPEHTLQNWEACLLARFIADQTPPEEDMSQIHFEFESEINDSDPLVIQIQSETEGLSGKPLVEYLTSFYAAQHAVEEVAELVS